MPKHVHADLIKVWADGEEIEFQNKNGEWNLITYPNWSPNLTYRIKPKAKKYQVRFFIYRPYNAYYNHVCGNVRTVEDEALWEKDSRFIKWITDWVEYDV